MNEVATIDYKNYSEDNALQFVMLILLFVLLLFVLIIMRNGWLAMGLVVFFVLIDSFVSKKDGYYKILHDEEDYYLVPAPGAAPEKIKHLKFRFSYNYVGTGTGRIRKGGAVKFDMLWLEIACENTKEYAICKNLNMWTSIPSDWKYAIFEEKKYSKVVNTKFKLEELKEMLDHLTV